MVHDQAPVKMYTDEQMSSESTNHPETPHTWPDQPDCCRTGASTFAASLPPGLQRCPVAQGTAPNRAGARCDKLNWHSARRHVHSLPNACSQVCMRMCKGKCFVEMLNVLHIFLSPNIIYWTIFCFVFSNKHTSLWSNSKSKFRQTLKD